MNIIRPIYTKAFAKLFSKSGKSGGKSGREKMYLHIGNGKSVRRDKIIGIFDLDTATVTKSGKDFISSMERSGKLIYDDMDLPRSFVLVEEENGSVIRLSRISTAGLKLRLDGRDES